MHVRRRACTVRVTATFMMLMRIVVRVGHTRMLIWTTHFDRHQIHLPMTHAAFGDQRLRKAFHLRCRAAQNRCFQAMIVIEMDMHRRHTHIMMRMMGCRHPRGKIALVMVVHVAHASDAVRRCFGGEPIRL